MAVSNNSDIYDHLKEILTKIIIPLITVLVNIVLRN